MLAAVSLMTSGVAFVMAFGQLLSKQRTYKNWVTFGLFFNMGCLFLNSYLFYSRVIIEYPVVMHMHLPFFFLLTPLLYIMYRIILEKEYRFSFFSLFHFLPSLVVTALLIPYYWRTDYQAKTTEFMQVMTNVELAGLPAWLFFIGGIYLFLYLLFMLKGLTGILKWQYLRNEHNSAILLLIVFSSLVAGSLLNLSFVLRDLAFMEAATWGMCLIMIMVNLIGRRYPGFLEGLQVIAETERYSRSLIDDLNLAELQQNLDELMQEEKIYHEEEISLARFAQILGISSHQLSQFLNEKLARNFSTFINEYRIQEAKRLLVENKENTVLNIAYQVGFNSKSAFNKAFRKLVEMTPSEYRKSKP